MKIEETKKKFDSVTVWPSGEGDTQTFFLSDVGAKVPMTLSKWQKMIAAKGYELDGAVFLEDTGRQDEYDDLKSQEAELEAESA